MFQKKKNNNKRKKKDNGGDPGSTRRMDRMKIKENEARAYGSLFSDFCVPNTSQCKWHIGHTSRQG